MRYIGMSHATVEVDRLSGLQQDRRIGVGMKFELPFKNKQEFIARMIHEAAEFCQTSCPHVGDDRREFLVQKISAEIGQNLTVNLNNVTRAMLVDADAASAA